MAVGVAKPRAHGHAITTTDVKICSDISNLSSKSIGKIIVPQKNQKIKDIMAIIIGENTKVIVQGITGAQGSFHTGLMLEYGTTIVAGVTPGKSGLKIHGIPVYDTVQEAAQRYYPNASIIFVLCSGLTLAYTVISSTSFCRSSIFSRSLPSIAFPFIPNS